MLFFADFIANQVNEAAAAWTGEDDAEVEDTFLKGARDLQERRAGGELDGGCHHEIADEKEGHRAVEQAEQDEDPAERLRLIRLRPWTHLRCEGSEGKGS